MTESKLRGPHDSDHCNDGGDENANRDGLHRADGRAFQDPSLRCGGRPQAVVAMLSPMATPKIRTSIDSVSEAAVSESTPRRATKNISTTPKRDSITISRIIWDGEHNNGAPEIAFGVVEIAAGEAVRTSATLPVPDPMGGG